MNDFIKEIKLLADACIIANEFDYVPSDLGDIDKGILLYPKIKSSSSDIKRYQGLRSDEVKDRLVDVIIRYGID